MAANSDEQTGKRRKVRKGTHSCWECRRRKVKCIFALPDDATCIICRRRGKRCIGQEIADDCDTSPESKEFNPGYHGFDDQPLAYTGENRSQDLQHAPISPPPSLTVFELSMQVLTPGSSRTPASSRVSIAGSNKYTKITQVLLQALPCEEDVQILLGKVLGVSTMCYQFKYKPATSLRKGHNNEQISFTNLLDPKGHPIPLARQMLLMAAALQYLSPNKIIPGLTKHHHAIMEQLAESAIKMVTTNDGLLGTLEGLETIILEAFYHIDSGNVRRAWITMRRAAMAAQLMGLHRPGQHRFKVINDESDLDSEAMWACIVFLERLLSLLLGLPTSTGAADIESQVIMGVPSHNGDMATLVVDVTAKILHRNETNVSHKALELTQEADRKLINMTEQMPSDFWRPLALEGLEKDSEEAFWEIRRCWDHMCYYTLVVQLHLPYMMCPNHASQSVYSRIACANASREILTREIAVRIFNRATPYYRLGDFMALIAGLTLMLAHIVSHAGDHVDNLLAHQRLADRAVVERALECMQSMSEVHEDLLAAKCANLLKHLLAAEAQTAQGRNHPSNNPPNPSGNCENEDNVLTIMVPYVGAFRIARGGMTTIGSLKTAQDQGADEAFRIGCLQILHGGGPERRFQNLADSAPGVGGSQIASMDSINAPEIDENATLLPQYISEEQFMQQDQMFPDAAASMDDWVFQGFDTAFFDVLTREIDNQ